MKLKAIINRMDIIDIKDNIDTESIKLIMQNEVETLLYRERLIDYLINNNRKKTYINI